VVVRADAGGRVLVGAAPRGQAPRARGTLSGTRRLPQRGPRHRARPRPRAERRARRRAAPLGDVDAARLGARLHPLHPGGAGVPADLERRQLNVDIFRPILQALFILAVPPVMLGVITKTKAVFAGRVGPPVLQPYYDLAKLLRKGSVFSRTTTWVFRAGPVVVLPDT